MKESELKELMNPYSVRKIKAELIRLGFKDVSYLKEIKNKTVAELTAGTDTLYADNNGYKNGKYGKYFIAGRAFELGDMDWVIIEKTRMRKNRSFLKPDKIWVFAKR